MANREPNVVHGAKHINILDSCITHTFFVVSEMESFILVSHLISIGE